MRFIKNDNDKYNEYILIDDDNKKLRMFYGGTLDLYWSLTDNDLDITDDKSSSSTFIITKENYSLYSEFVNLFRDMDNINIFDDEEYIPFDFDNIKEKEKYLEERRKNRKREKTKYKKYNSSRYNDLYDKKNRTITWVSDETSIETGNILRIKEEKDSFVLEFSTQPNVAGYDNDFKTRISIPIRFRNSGSSYDPFNIIFMRMYEKMKQVDDINDYGHQIHIEEYLYSQSKIKKITK